MMMVDNQDSTLVITLTHTLEQVTTTTGDLTMIPVWVHVMVTVVHGHSTQVVTKHRHLTG